MNYEARIKNYGAVIFSCLFILTSSFLIFPSLTYGATDPESAANSLKQNQQDIAAKEAEIAELEAKIETLRGQRDVASNEAALIESQVARLNAALNKANLEIQQTKLAIGDVSEQQTQNEKDIEKIQQGIEDNRTHLRQLVRDLHKEEQGSWVMVFFTTGSISEALAERSAYQHLQEEVAQAAAALADKLAALESKQQALEEQEQELANLANLQRSQEADLSQQEADKKTFLAAKREEQAEFEHLLAEAKQARDEIKNNLYSLKSAGVEVTLTSATDMAKLASKLTGIRAPLLLAVLKVETNVGANIGGGKYPDDMHPRDHEAFLRITKALGMNPLTTPVAARPRSLKGWGGAMGPGQFMPSTWEGIAPRVAGLLGKSVANPYDLQDAMVATALYLADKGGTDPAREFEAVTRYIAGPNWQYHRWYGDRVMAVAKEYEGNI